MPGAARRSQAGWSRVPLIANATAAAGGAYAGARWSASRGLAAVQSQPPGRQHAAHPIAGGTRPPRAKIAGIRRQENQGHQNECGVDYSIMCVIAMAAWRLRDLVKGAALV